MVVKVRQKGWLAKLSEWFSGKEAWKRIELDSMGSFVWERCDGERSVGQIVDDLCDEYRLHRREAEASLAEFLTELRKRGLVEMKEGE